MTQSINIYVVDILDFYGLLLRKDWFSKLNRYFATNWSHLCLQHKGVENKIRVDREDYMKYVVIELDGKIEPIPFKNYSLGNYCVDTCFREFQDDLSPYVDSSK